MALCGCHGYCYIPAENWHGVTLFFVKKLIKCKI